MPQLGSSSTSKTCVTYSLEIMPAARASRRKRSIASARNFASARRSLSATRRSVRRLRAV
jgi:hypothetical protein